MCSKWLVFYGLVSGKEEWFATVAVDLPGEVFYSKYSKGNGHPKYGGKIESIILALEVLATRYLSIFVWETPPYEQLYSVLR